MSRGKQECGNCRFWCRAPMAEPSFCKRHGPVLISETGFQGQLNSRTSWPITRGRDWCGDWQEHVEK